MGKALVIVESPAKVKTINKFLGKQYLVKSSVGHIRDLAKLASKSSTKAKPKKKLTEAEKKKRDREKLITQMGLDPYNNWHAEYEILPGKEKVLKGLREAAAKVETIYLATDLDREGEAIAWHLMEAIGGDKNRYQRVTFTEITKKAVMKAFETPGRLNTDRVNAQQARRFLDRVVGYMLSPLLWQKIARGLSAGRVQSVAVRLISEREQSIHAFKPEEYWEVRNDVKTKKNEPLLIELSKKNGQAYKAKSKDEVDGVVKALETNPHIVTKAEMKPTRSKPSAPYITSTLQQSASVRLGFGVKKTMLMAQRLYEAGHITYMRTDSTNLSQDAVAQCRDYIQESYGKNYLPEEPVSYSSKKSAQEAHEAIRPTNVDLRAEGLKDTERDAQRLYDLIWRQFVACQMLPAQFDSTSVLVQCGDYELKTRGRVLRFDGYLKVQPQVKKQGEEDTTLPEVKVGDELKLVEINPSQHFTKPPPRFTEASLVKELEKRGIGRPSTYAAIISTIQDRGYVKVEKRRFFCLKMGEIVTERLKSNFEELMDFNFTASLEEDLDKIAAGNVDWHKILDDFYGNFTTQLEKASANMRGNEPISTDIKCPDCGRNMNIRTARTGVFLSCEGYALPPKERCKGTLNLISGDEMESFDENYDEGNVEEIRNKKRCTKCDTAMDSYFIDEERKLHICGNSPECHGHEIEFGKFRIKGYDGPVITCDKCESDMQLKSGRFGKYFACTSETCKNTRKLLKNGEPAPPRVDPIHMPELKCEKSDGYFVLRDGAAGIFLASSAFPKSKETKKPQVADLVRHKDELDPKYAYLAKAPEEDPEGNPVIIRFSRKTKEHYVMSEKEGKATGWIAHWKENRWVPKEK